MFNLCKSDNALAIFPASWPFEINPVQNRLAATEGFAHEETVAASGYGFYHDDTRVVRGMAVNICGQERQKLKTELLEHGCTPEGEHWWRIQTPAGVFEHRTFMHNDCFHHSFRAFDGTVIGAAPFLTVEITPGFEDIFEVRGALETWIRDVQSITNGGKLTLFHSGKDGQVRFLTLNAPTVRFAPHFDGNKITFDLPLSASQTGFVIGAGRAQELKGLPNPAYEKALAELVQARADFAGRFALPDNLPPEFQGWAQQAMTDLFQLQGKAGEYPCTQAGLPWFAALFGRDSIIASEQTLAVAPDFARDTLRALGAFQAVADDPRFDAQPGKIPHELRFGERCRLGHIPFGRYYGGIDTTPLYISLMQRYIERTNDALLLAELAPVLEGAVGWLEKQLQDHQFLTYRTNKEEEGPHGFNVKGWKEGAPALDADGNMAANPVALCEVQGYAYHALISAASLLKRLASPEERVSRLLERAAKLRKDFNEIFWMEEFQTFAMSLDGNGYLYRAETSNPGHLLRTDIVDDARKIAGISRSLTAPERLFSGWGVRTLSANAKLFEAESYQLGGVWPHDTCEALRGLLHVGAIDAARVIYNGLSDLARSCSYRLPELITGHKRQGNVPTVYANSCSPQAWSASIPFALMPHWRELNVA